MTDAVLSLRVWSYCVLAVGAGLLLIPNQIFDTLGITNTGDVWVSVVGLVAIALGVVYFAGARDNDLGVVRSSLPARAIAVIAFVALWITGGPWQLLIFAAADLTGLLWSRHALRVGAGPAGTTAQDDNTGNMSF